MRGLSLSNSLSPSFSFSLSRSLHFSLSDSLSLTHKHTRVDLGLGVGAAEEGHACVVRSCLRQVDRRLACMRGICWIYNCMFNSV